MIVRGSVAVPGDKSLTHRLLLLAGLAPGRSRLKGALTSLDARSTARILRGLGIGVSSLRPNADVLVQGRARFKRPLKTLDCGNSGTTARLSLGLLAAHRFTVHLTGDNSLRRRPMGRVTEPLAQMGAHFGPTVPDRLPFAVRGGSLNPLEWRLPVSSAQIKGCLLFAGLAGGVPLSLLEPSGRSRDHTERLLRAFGYSVVEDAAGWIHFSPSGSLEPFELSVPGDPSSAAFLVGAALLAERGSLSVMGVGLNPTRTGFLRVLERMGAQVTVAVSGERCGEPVGDLHIRPAPLRGTTVTATEIPGLIDEVPMLAILAAQARGETRFHEVGELRIKESNRLELLAENLRAVGSQAAVEGNTLVIEGAGAAPVGRVHTQGDHRLAMAFAVLRVVPGAKVRVDDLQCAEVSFPGFDAMLRRITAK
jgi:3-phosphoshikimate 1-carboxyvinyltransferase